MCSLGGLVDDLTSWFRSRALAILRSRSDEGEERVKTLKLDQAISGALKSPARITLLLCGLTPIFSREEFNSSRLFMSDAFDVKKIQERSIWCLAQLCGTVSK